MHLMLNSTFCTGCHERYYLSRNNSCFEKCLTPLMVRGQPRPICKHCSYDCLTCNQYGECLTCNASEYRKLNPKNSRCQPLKGYYDDRSFVCKKCH